MSTTETANVILVDDFARYKGSEKMLNELFKQGRTLAFIEWQRFVPDMQTVMD